MIRFYSKTIVQMTHVVIPFKIKCHSKVLASEWGYSTAAAYSNTLLMVIRQRIDFHWMNISMQWQKNNGTKKTFSDLSREFCDFSFWFHSLIAALFFNKTKTWNESACLIFLLLSQARVYMFCAIFLENTAPFVHELIAYSKHVSCRKCRIGKNEFRKWIEHSKKLLSRNAC